MLSGMSTDTKAIIGTIIGTVSGASLALAALILQGHASIGERLNRLEDRTAELQERVAYIEATLAARD